MNEILLRSRSIAFQISGGGPARQALTDLAGRYLLTLEAEGPPPATQRLAVAR